MHLIQISDLNSGFFTFFLLGTIAIAILSGVLIITTKNPIVSVLFLILLFASVSCNLIFLGMIFIGISYLLVYVGAVSILFLFILMLINIRVSELITDTNNSIPLAVLTLLAFFTPISSVLPDKAQSNSTTLESLINNKDIQVFYVSSSNWEGNIMNVTDITSIGNIMYTNYSMWLIITPIILLLAMVGSIVITIKQKD